VTRWEYLTVSFWLPYPTLEQILDEHGPAGWELAAVAWDARKVVFKRPGGEVR